MMIIKPEDVKFELDHDVMDYVGLGLPPTKKNFDKVIKAVEESANENNKAVLGKVYVPYNPYRTMSEKDFEDVLYKVYENNCRTRNRWILAMVAAVGITAGVTKAIVEASCKKEDEEDD